MRYDSFSPVRFRLDHCIHINFLKDDEPISPVAVCVHLLVLVDGFTETGNDECRKRKRLACTRLIGTNHTARLGHIHFYQSMDGMFPRGETPSLNRYLPFHRKWQYVICCLIFVHLGLSRTLAPSSLPDDCVPPTRRADRRQWSHCVHRRSYRA